MEDGAVATVTTSKGVTLAANEFVLATGSFIGGGLQALRSGVSEVLFGADVVAPAVTELTNRDIFEPQPFMNTGIVTDEQFKVVVDGKAIDNLYGCGAVLAGFNPVKEGCGAGVSMFTALKVAEDIINR
jgi:glycerol-3-phosphate dehydrogenase subunit B